MSGTVSTRNRNLFRSVNRTATTPRPIATVATIVNAVSGARLNERRANRTSRTVSSTNAVPRWSRHSSATSAVGPNRARAAARARSGGMPSSISFLASRSMWNESSSSRSRSTRRAGHQGAQAELQIAKAHTHSYASFMTRPIAFDIRSHSRVSAVRRRRPVVVSR